MLCTKGTAITYLRKAAEFDGWGAGQQLRLRYHGFSKQRGKTLKTTIENIRHVLVHGTNITTHIDLFEKLITQISYIQRPSSPSLGRTKDRLVPRLCHGTYLRFRPSYLLGGKYRRQANVPKDGKVVYPQMFSTLPRFSHP